MLCASASLFDSRILNCENLICRGIEEVITGLTRNQFVPKAHEGSNPSLCARRFNLTHSGWIEPFLLAHRKWILTMRRTSQGSHLSVAIGELAHQWRSDKSSPLVNTPPTVLSVGLLTKTILCSACKSHTDCLCTVELTVGIKVAVDI